MRTLDRLASNLGILVPTDKGTSTPMPRALNGGYGDTANRDADTSDLIFAYRYHSWVYSAIRAIAGACSSVPFIVVNYKGSGNKRPRSIRDFSMRYRDRKSVV